MKTLRATTEFVGFIALASLGDQAAAQPILNPANGHYYEAVVFDNEADFPTWDMARIASESSSFHGVHSYLATITSRSENDFLIEHIGPLRSPRGDLWIGGSDAAVEGEWRWVTGPEAGTLFWLGGAAGTQMSFADWATGSPNDAFGPASESRLGWVEDGWNDLPDWMVRPGFIIEYSDVPDEDPGYSRGIEYTQLQIRPNPIFTGRGGDLVAVTRGLTDLPQSPYYRVVSAEFQVAGGPWRPLQPLDGSFDGTWETTLGNVGPFFEPGNYKVCARVTFNGGETTMPSCLDAHVHSPGTVTMAGAGSITAFPVAWTDDCLRDTIGGGSTGAGAVMHLNVDARRTDETIHQVEGQAMLHTEAFSLTSDYLYEMFGEHGRADLTGSGIIHDSTGCGFNGVNADFVLQIVDGASDGSLTADKARLILRDIFTGATIYDSWYRELEDIAPEAEVSGDFTLTGR